MEIMTSWKREGITEGRQQGVQQGEATIILNQMHRRFGEDAAVLRDRIQGLSTQQLERLGEALLDFSQLSDLQAWLADNA